MSEKLVDFIICGAQKSGTSALDSYLRDHPEICMANGKEVHFFDNELFFNNAEPDYHEYYRCFEPSARQRLLGEATPIYMYWLDAPRRIWEYNAQMKLIVLLRNPIDRAYSHWNMECSRNAEQLSFWDALQNETERSREALPFQHRVYSYLDRGFYMEQLRRLWRFFPKERVLILKNEYLKDQPSEALNQVCDFLEVNPFENSTHRDVHSHTYHRKMSEKERQFLCDMYENEIKEIERTLGWDCSDWLD